MNEGQRQQLLEAIDDNNEVGFIDAAQTPDQTNENALAIRLGDGVTVFAPADSFTKTGADKFRFNGNFNLLRRESASRAANAENQTNRNQPNLAAIDARTNERGEIVVPLIAEEIKISKKTVETGGVRVHKTVSETVQRIDEPIIREHLDVKRVEINKFVETAPAIRYEGDVMIVPVLEEVVVTQKRLMLREEIHLTKRREEIANVEEVILRREEINLQKIEDENIESGETGAIKQKTGERQEKSVFSLRPPQRTDKKG